MPLFTHTLLFFYRNRKGTRHQEFPSQNTAPRRQAPPPRRPRTVTEHHLQRQATATELLAGVVPTEPSLYNVHTVNSEVRGSHALQLTTTKANLEAFKDELKRKNITKNITTEMENCWLKLLCLRKEVS